MNVFSQTGEHRYHAVMSFSHHHSFPSSQPEGCIIKGRFLRPELVGVKWELGECVS